MRAIQFTTRVDNQGWERTTLVLPYGTDEPSDLYQANFDVVLPNGRQLCKMNVMWFDSGGWGQVDVILNPQEQVGTFLAFGEGGHHLIRERLVSHTSLMINISPRRPGETGYWDVPSRFAEEQRPPA